MRPIKEVNRLRGFLAAAYTRVIIRSNSVAGEPRISAMFDYIKIEGFRSFKKVELDMPRLAVLIGPNGGGKSNFLDLLKLMAEAGHGELNLGVNKRGGFRNIAFGFDSSSDVGISFRFNDLPVKLPQSSILQTGEASEAKLYDIRFNLGLRGLGVNFNVWEEKLRVESPKDALLRSEEHTSEL